MAQGFVGMMSTIKETGTALLDARECVFVQYYSESAVQDGKEENEASVVQQNISTISFSQLFRFFLRISSSFVFRLSPQGCKSRFIFFCFVEC